MSMKRLDIKYRCMHPSCAVNCREGYLTMDEDFFNKLKSQYEEPELFRSPRGVCRLGFSQTFKVNKMEVIDESQVAGKAAAADELAKNDPILVLVDEHKTILKKLEAIEEQLRKRDLEGLWMATNQLENALVLHSGIKEEEVLFPTISGIVPLGESLIAIVKEEHREVLSLLHAFRTALEDGDILDGLLISVNVSLKSHIRKEDQEFFEMLAKYIDDDLKKSLIEGMKKVGETYVPIEPGDRLKISEEKKAAKAKRDQMNEEFAAIKENTMSGCCH